MIGHSIKVFLVTVDLIIWLKMLTLCHFWGTACFVYDFQKHLQEATQLSFTYFAELAKLSFAYVA